MIQRIRVLAVLLGMIASTPAFACSSFAFGTPQMGGLAHNFDWYNQMGYTAAMYINARNTTKDGLNLFTKDPVAHWTSKYGSVTYSLVGREFPVGGQNEKGLIVHAQQITGAVYPTDTSLPVTDALQWMQYLLDTSATIDEAVANAKLIRPMTSLSLHYILCDASSNCAVVEFVNGQMVVYSHDQLPARAMTNTDYSVSLSTWQSCQQDKSTCQQSDNSLQRFVQSSGLSAQYQSQEPMQYALAGLNFVAQHNSQITTRYHFYTPAAANPTMYFASDAQTAWQSIDMSKIDFSCANGGKYFEVDLNGTGEQSAKFIPYDVAEQTKLVNQVPAKPEWKPLMINYPTTTTCH